MGPLLSSACHRSVSTIGRATAAAICLKDGLVVEKRRRDAVGGIGVSGTSRWKSECALKIQSY